MSFKNNFISVAEQPDFIPLMSYLQKNVIDLIKTHLLNLISAVLETCSARIIMAFPVYPTHNSPDDVYFVPVLVASVPHG